MRDAVGDRLRRGARPRSRHAAQQSIGALAAGLVAGSYLHKHQAEIALALSKVGGLGKGFLLRQKERLGDLVEEAKEREGQGASTAKPEQAPA